MKRFRAQNGFTLIEMLVVLTIMTLLFAAGAPAIKALQNAFSSTGSVVTMVKSALGAARVLAMRDQRYVGVRFQEDLEGHQYMIFVRHDYDETGLAPGVRAIEGMRVIKLPDRFCVLDLKVRTNHEDATDHNDEAVMVEHLLDSRENMPDLGSGTIRANRDLWRSKYWIDMSTFSVTFSGALGTVEIRKTRARNRQGDYTPTSVADASDDVFNSPINIIDHDAGRFIQDDYAEFGLGEELSRNQFVICNREEFANLRSPEEKHNYLSSLPSIYVNRHHGISIIPGK
ncbi:MAG: prepilin-type N-terminal cleavage/methylation domain-containing protein [Planctomycetes bacterium]|nr:prepilin-type N-terminal cleavage/methylation domain-containing protein [Planctomycetota bacterium]